MKALLIAAAVLAGMGAVGWLASRWGPRLSWWVLDNFSQRAWP
jgi:hypothetical protein